MADDIGWRYLSSDGSVLDDENANSLYNTKFSDGSGTYRNAEGSRENIFSDGSGFFYGADGSYGTKYSDGGAYYHGADGSYGTRFSDGSAYYYGKDGSYCQRFSDGSVSYRAADGNSHYYSSGDERIDSLYREIENSDICNSNVGGDNSYAASGGALLGILAGLVLGGSSDSSYSDASADVSDIGDDYELPDIGGDNIYEPINFDLEYEDRFNSFNYDEYNEENIKETNKNDPKINTEHIGISKRILDKILGKKAISGISSKLCKGKKYYDIEKYLREQGFYNIEIETVEDLTMANKMNEGCVEKVFFGDVAAFGQDSLFRIDSKARIVYHAMKMSTPPYTNGSSKRRDYKMVYNEFTDAGFENIKCEPIYDLVVGFLNKPGNVESVLINGRNDYNKRQRIRVDAPIIIRYHSFDKCKKT